MTLATGNPVNSSYSSGPINTTSTVNFSRPLRALYVETAGRLRLTFKDGTETNIETMDAGWTAFRDIASIHSDTDAVVHGYW